MYIACARAVLVSAVLVSVYIAEHTMTPCTRACFSVHCFTSTLFQQTLIKTRDVTRCGATGEDFKQVRLNKSNSLTGTCQLDESGPRDSLLQVTPRDSLLQVSILRRQSGARWKQRITCL